MNSVTLTNLQSLVMYLACFGTAALFFALGRKFKMRSFTIIGILIPTIVGGLRYMVGVDYSSYMEKLLVAPEMGYPEFYTLFGGMEIGLWLFGFLPWQIFFGATSFLTILFFYLGFKRFNVKHIGLAMLLIMLIIFPQAMGGIRQGVAMAMSFFAFSFVQERKLLPFVITLLAASIFHFSALTMLAVYPFYWLVIDSCKTERRYACRMFYMSIVMIAIIFIGFRIISYIPILSKYAYYLTDEFSIGYGILTGTHNILPEIFALLFGLLFYKRLIFKSKSGKFYFAMILLMLLVTCIGFVIPLASRLADYFMPFFFLLFLRATNVFTDTLSKRIVIAMIILYALLFFIGGVYLHQSGEIFPYQFISLW